MNRQRGSCPGYGDPVETGISLDSVLDLGLHGNYARIIILISIARRFDTCRDCRKISETLQPVRTDMCVSCCDRTCSYDDFISSELHYY